MYAYVKSYTPNGIKTSINQNINIGATSSEEFSLLTRNVFYKTLASKSPRKLWYFRIR